MHHVSDDFLCETTSPALGKIHANILETYHWQINNIKTNFEGRVFVLIYLVKPVIISSYAFN